MYETVKRGLDIVGAVVLAVVLAPLFIGVAVGLKLTAEHRVLFRQPRMGQNGQSFCILKFCTMRSDTPPNVAFAALPNAEAYITPFGRWLRRTSVDELPQLWNILKGDMSFVGPRPVVLTETDLLAERARLGADTCRPGLTGLAQVKGRATLGFREKAWYDALYNRYRSFRLDGWILLKTIPCVFQFRSHPPHSAPSAEST